MICSNKWVLASCPSEYCKGIMWELFEGHVMILITRQPVLWTSRQTYSMVSCLSLSLLPFDNPKYKTEIDPFICQCLYSVIPMVAYCSESSVNLSPWYSRRGNLLELIAIFNCVISGSRQMRDNLCGKSMKTLLWLYSITSLTTHGHVLAWWDCSVELSFCEWHLKLS